MPDEPYRPPPSPSEAEAELARLAAQGQQRILQASERDAAAQARRDEQSRDAYLLLAIGSYYGKGYRRGALGLLLASVVVMAAGATAAATTPYGMPILLLGVLGLVLAIVGLVIGAPKATPAKLAAEEAWVRSLPFPLTGYFEALSTEPSLACRLWIDLTWEPGRAPEPDLVQGVLGLLDTRARTEPRAGGIGIRSCVISCLRRTENRRAIKGTERLVAYVHELVDRVLLPVHRTHAIAGAVVSRDENLSTDELRVAYRIGKNW